MRRSDSFEKTLMLGKTKGRRRRGRQRTWWLDGIADSMDMSWVNSGSWWWTGRPGVLQSIGSQRVGHDWETELTDWTDQLSVAFNAIVLAAKYVRNLGVGWGEGTSPLAGSWLKARWAGRECRRPRPAPSSARLRSHRSRRPRSRSSAWRRAAVLEYPRPQAAGGQRSPSGLHPRRSPGLFHRLGSAPLPGSYPEPEAAPHPAGKQQRRSRRWRRFPAETWLREQDPALHPRSAFEGWS